MLSVLLAIHMIACVALVIAVLLQRSEGGALGMGGGGAGGFISGRGAAGVLVKVTMVLAAVFFTTSLVMTRMNSEASRAPADLERQLQERQSDGFDPLTGGRTSTPSDATPAVPDPLAPPPSAPSATPESVLPPPASSADPLAPVINPQSQPVSPAQENSGSLTP